VHNLQFSFPCYIPYLMGLAIITLHIHANSLLQYFTYFYFLFNKSLSGLEDVMANEKMVNKLWSLNERINSRSLVLGTVSASASEN
jgi:hypothetical protein